MRRLHRVGLGGRGGEVGSGGSGGVGRGRDGGGGGGRRGKWRGRRGREGGSARSREGERERRRKGRGEDGGSGDGEGEKEVTDRRICRRWGEEPSDGAIYKTALVTFKKNKAVEKALALSGGMLGDRQVRFGLSQSRFRAWICAIHRRPLSGQPGLARDLCRRCETDGERV